MNLTPLLTTSKNQATKYNIKKKLQNTIKSKRTILKISRSIKNRL